MMPSGFVVLASLSFCVLTVRASDATSPIDYTRRNAPLAPSGTVTPPKQTPSTNTDVQQKRVKPATLPKTESAVGGQRAGIDVKETNEKTVREKDSHRPEKVDQPQSAFNERRAAITTSADQVKPPLVEKYQEKLAAASATNMARFPALDRATKAKLNRFVFQKNPADISPMTQAAPVVPAAGGAEIRK